MVFSKRFPIMKQVGLGYAALFLLVAFHLEITSYVFTSYGWPRLSPVPVRFRFDPNDPNRIPPEEPLKILLVSDPQLIGERDELPLIGIFSRWDADRYLSKTYRLAKFHVQPDAVIFLGDLFDEGSKATKEETSRYLNRLINIFRLRQYDGIKYMFLPGDNDVGGENEPIFTDKVRWFNETLAGGDIANPVVLYHNDLWIRLMMMHLFLPNVFNDPLESFNPNNSELRIALTHLSCLKIFHFCAKRLENMSPALVLSGDSHHSTYYQLGSPKKNFHGKTDPTRRVTVYKDFLVPGARNYTFEEGMFDGSVKFREESLRLQLRLTNDTPSRLTHEITVPTCSYRMGVPNMGYGYLEIYKNGTTDYTVLWLPSRFHQLYIYVGFYILSKFIFTPWIFWRVARFLWRKYLELRTRFRARTPSFSAKHKHQV